MTGALIPAFVGGQLCPVDKLEVHQRGLRHPAVSVFVMRGDQVLMQQRALGKYHTPGLWTNTCCTHPFWGEAPHDCAARRLRQEMGLAGLVLRRAGGVEYRADVFGGLTEHEVVDIFIAEAPQGLEPVPNPDEVAAVAWMGIGELLADLAARPELYTPWMQIYMAHYRHLIFAEAPLA
ncbi:isopentenyl-diphosphate Delta-isomerase [Pseudotabrizicola sp. L79]|uniref:isopentenyl-diphosphate Delta-isomerase n=1 Tax=Pseudotabrizicola sp. L79 TaxID=3118402 RepID=UPI002F949418